MFMDSRPAIWWNCKCPVAGMTTGHLQILDILFHKCSQHAFGHGADLGRLNLTVFEYHHGGDATDVVVHRGRAVGINIHLGHRQFSCVFIGNFVDQRCNHFARATPFSPIVDQYGSVCIQNFFFEVTVCDVDNVVAQCISPIIRAGLRVAVRLKCPIRTAVSKRSKKGGAES
jgi:hypothetical protein